MFFVILVDDVYCVAIHDLSPVLTALFSIELGGFNKYIYNFRILQLYSYINVIVKNVIYCGFMKFTAKTGMSSFNFLESFFTGF